MTAYTEHAPQPADPGPITVLVVDDEESIRAALRRYLTNDGYDVSVAADGFEALLRLREREHQVMLTDVRMPGMNGIELAAKALEMDPDLAVLMLTAVNEPRVAIESLRLGAADYLIKPVDLEELSIAIKAAARRRTLEVERRELERWLGREVMLKTKELAEATARAEELTVRAFVTLVDVVEARDPATAGFAHRVGTLAGAMAAKMGLSPEMVREVRHAGFLHPLGRIALTEPTLMEAVRMTDDPADEGAQVEALERLLAPLTTLGRVPALVRALFRRGATDGADAADEVVLGGRVLATARMFATASQRGPKRPGLAAPEAVQSLRASVGVAIDPMVFEVLEEVVEGKGPAEG